MRVYVPVTLAMLQRLVDDGALNPVNGTAFAVTPALREAYANGDDDELAEVALRDAALASLRLLADEPLARRGESTDEPVARRGESTDEPLARRGEDTDRSGLPPRRAVLVADVDDATPLPLLDDAVVRLVGPVPMDRVVCVHVDNAAAEDAVKAAAEVIDAADLGDEDAEFAVGDAQDHELAWYAPQELPFLLELL
ncbi:MAG TPA: hypothetical protein VH496_12595 [Mycobacterium sp.]|jgi:hypothetical protein